MTQICLQEYVSVKVRMLYIILCNIIILISVPTGESFHRALFFVAMVQNFRRKFLQIQEIHQNFPSKINSEIDSIKYVFVLLLHCNNISVTTYIPVASAKSWKQEQISQTICMF